MEVCRRSEYIAAPEPAAAIEGPQPGDLAALKRNKPNDSEALRQIALKATRTDDQASTSSPRPTT